MRDLVFEVVKHFFPRVCSVEVISGQNHNSLMITVFMLFLGLGIMLLIINYQNSYISAVWNEIDRSIGNWQHLMLENDFRIAKIMFGQ